MRRRPPTAKISVAVHDELGHVPTTEEVEQVLLRSQVREQAVLGLHYRRKEQRQTGQLAMVYWTCGTEPWLRQTELVSR